MFFNEFKICFFVKFLNGWARRTPDMGKIDTLKNLHKTLKIEEVYSIFTHVIAFHVVVLP